MTNKHRRGQNTGPFFIIFSLWLLMFAASSQLMIIAPILTTIQEELAIPQDLLGTLITAYAVSLAITGLIAGPISDKVGRRRVLAAGTAAMALALALHAVTYDYSTFLLVRSLAGAAGGILSGASVAYVGDYFPYEKRGWANGYIATGIAVGQIAGIPMGIVLAEWFGFRGPFTLFAGIMALAFLLIYLFLPQPDVRRAQGRLTIGSALEKYIKLLFDGVGAATAAAFGLMYFSLSMYIVYFPTWLEESFGVDGYDLAAMFFVGGLVTVVTGPRAGQLSDRIGRKRMILWACVGLAALTALTTSIIFRPFMMYVLFALIMFCVASRMSPFQALVTQIVPAEERGSLMSLSIGLGQIGMGIGGALAGITYTRSGFFLNTIISAISILLMGMIVWFFIPEPELSVAPGGPPAAEKAP